MTSEPQGAAESHFDVSEGEVDRIIFDGAGAHQPRRRARLVIGQSGHIAATRCTSLWPAAGSMDTRLG